MTDIETDIASNTDIVAAPSPSLGRRDALRGALAGGAAAALPACVTTPETDKAGWGAALGYPTGWGPPGQPPRWEAYPEYRVGNFSGGFERMFRHGVLRAEGPPSALALSGGPGAARLQAAAAAHLRAWPVTGLLIQRDGEILFEGYGLDRTAEMRLTSWSMAKSVTSLLLGIALDRGLVRSIDDVPADYVPALRGTLHGGIRLRHLLNMSSGAEVDHARDPVRIDVPALLGRPQSRAAGTDLERVVRDWTGAREAPGARFNYNELCPLTIGMVIRAASGTSLAQFAQDALWRPIGAEGDATWLCDSLGREYNCAGFAARLRDWARLGRLVADRGQSGGRQVVSAGYIADCARWGPEDAQVAFGAARRDSGYKNFFWHPRADGQWLVMNGHLGQRLAVDRHSRTVMVRTAVSHDGPWSQDFSALFDAATRV